ARARRVPRRPHLGGHGRARGGRGRRCAAWRSSRARRPHGADGWARRHLRVRRPDAQLPGRGRHQRAPDRRRAGSSPRRTLVGSAVPVGRAARPGPPDGRRWDHRPRHERHAHRPGHGDRRLGDLPGAAPPAPVERRLRPGGCRNRRVPQRASRRPGLRRALRGRRSGARRPLPRRQRDARLAHPDRARRGSRHRARGRQRHLHETRPGVRRTPAARRTHPRDPQSRSEGGPM
ncbi:MAG: Substrate-specific component NikM of nickel ECF transporter, partial [uncultured Nocardioides sp.]